MNLRVLQCQSLDMILIPCNISYVSSLANGSQVTKTAGKLSADNCLLRELQNKGGGAT